MSVFENWNAIERFDRLKLDRFVRLMIEILSMNNYELCLKCLKMGY